MVEPPVLAGRRKLTRALCSPGLTDVMVGAPGTVMVAAPAVPPIGASTAKAVPSIAHPHMPAFNRCGVKNDRELRVMRFPLWFVVDHDLRTGAPRFALRRGNRAATRKGNNQPGSERARRARSPRTGARSRSLISAAWAR